MINTVSSNVTTLGANLETYKTQIGNNINSTKIAITEAKNQILGTNTSVTLTYISNQAQNTLSNTKQTVSLLGTTVDDSSKATVFGRLTKVSEQIDSLEDKVDVIDTNVDTILAKVTSTNVLSGWYKDQLIASINTNLAAGKSVDETINLAITWLAENNLIKLN